MSVRSRDYMTIGEVVENLSQAYPDLSISKIRFLEEEGLINPERTAGGYRKFSPADLARVELILRLQKEHFLPLAVIREKLKDIDKGKVPADLKPTVAHAEAVTLPFEDNETLALDKAPGVLGLPMSFLRELAEFGLIVIRKTADGEELSRDDVEVSHACWDMRKFGIEPRHLRMYSTFSERESAFFQQILMPQFRHKTPESRQKLVESLHDLTDLTNELKRHLLHRALTQVFDDVV